MYSSFYKEISSKTQGIYLSGILYATPNVNIRQELVNMGEIIRFPARFRAMGKQNYFSIPNEVKHMMTIGESYSIVVCPLGESPGSSSGRGPGRPRKEPIQYPLVEPAFKGYWFGGKYYATMEERDAAEKAWVDKMNALGDGIKMEVQEPRAPGSG